MTKSEISEYDKREMKENLTMKQKAARLASALFAVALMCVVFYAAAAPDPDEPLLSAMQSLPGADAPGGLPVTDAQGLVHKKLYHLETRSFDVPGDYSLVFLPRRGKSLSVTVAMKGVFQVGLTSSQAPRIVLSSVGDTPPPAPMMDEITSEPPVPMPPGAVAVTFPGMTQFQNPGAQKPRSISGPVTIYVGPSKAYRIELPLKSVTQVYVGIRRETPTFSKLFLIRQDESGAKVSVHIPENEEKKIPPAWRLAALLLALIVIWKTPELPGPRGRAALAAGIAVAIFGLIVFHLPGAQSKPSGAITVLCALAIIACRVLKNPAPVYLPIGCVAALLFPFCASPVAVSTVCLAAICATLMHVIRRRKELNRAQWLMPFLLIVLFLAFEFQQQTRGRSEDSMTPMTGSRLDTWAVNRHTDLMNNHKDMRGEQFRGAFIHYEKREGFTRIIALGSSSTYGAGIGDPRRTWPAQLENVLREKCGPNIEVVNAGWGGYNAFQLAIWLKEVLWRYKPDTVILYYGGNEDGDNRPENYYEGIRREIDRLDNPDERSIARVLAYGTGRSSALVLFDNLSGLASYRILREMIVRPKEMTLPDNLPPPTITRSLQIMYETAEAHGFSLALIPEIEAQGGDRPTKTIKPQITQEMKEFASSRRIEFYDLTGRWDAVKNEAVSFDLVHLTPLGSSYLAEFAAESLIDGPILHEKCNPAPEEGQ